MKREGTVQYKPEHVAEELLPYYEAKCQKFADVEGLVDLVVGKKAPSLLITGQPGIGKTRLVRGRFLAASLLEGFDYKLVKGTGSPLGLYQMLYKNRTQAIVLDDSDGLFQDTRGIDLLKAALDSYDVRLVSWESPVTTKRLGLPSSFEFEGSIIFISNIDEHDMNPAVYSRSLHYNLVLKPKELLAFMYEIVQYIEPQVDVSKKLQVINFLAKNMTNLIANKNWNLRTLINAIRIREGGTSRWKRMALTSA